MFAVGMAHEVFDPGTWPPQAQAILDAAPDGMLVVAPDGTILLANSQVEVLFGYPRPELLGAPVELLVPAQHRDGHPAHRDRYRAEPRTRPMGAGLDLSGRRKDGSEFPAEISLSPLQLGEGRVTIAAIRDVTPRKRAEARFRGLLEAAADAMVILDPAGAIVQAREITTPGRARLPGRPPASTLKG